MRWLWTLTVVVWFNPGLSAEDAKSRTFRFQEADAGKLPAGWKAARTGKGDGSVWKVVADDTAPSKTGFVIAQTATGPRPLYNLCVAEDTDYRDVDIRVSIKSVKGKIDQGGGVVWRYRDPDNYYIARYNPLESNYRVYKVVAGQRKQLGTQEGIDVPAGQWNVLRVVQAGDHITCYLDGKKLLDVKDDTFAQSGKVGLWTKADAQTRFDGLQVGTPSR